jgi:hypothetical protein
VAEKVEAGLPMEPIGGTDRSPVPPPTSSDVVELVCPRCKWTLALSIDGRVFPARRAGSKVAGTRHRWHVTAGIELGRRDRLTVTCKCGHAYDVPAPTLRRLARRAEREGLHRWPVPAR